MTEVLLDVRDLAVDFRTDRGTVHVLDRVNFQVRRGEVMGLVGESGCGKTTLARAVLGVLPANSVHGSGGVIDFAGVDLLGLSALRSEGEVRGRRITFIPQDPFGSFNPLFRVRTQIRDLMQWKSPRVPAGAQRTGFAALLARYPRARRDVDDAAAIELLTKARIPQAEVALDKLPHEFSGGQRQRLMIAMALLPDPELIIADEPTTALDVTIQAQILGLLRELVTERGISVVLATHDMGTAHEICDRVTVMYAGQEMESAPTGAFFTRPAHPYTERLLASLPRPGHEIQEIGGEIPALIDPPAGCRFHPRCPNATARCREARPAPTSAGPDHWVRCHHPVRTITP